MRRGLRGLGIYAIIGFLILLLVIFGSSILRLLGYGQPDGKPERQQLPPKTESVMPYAPEDFHTETNGWKSYEHDGTEALHGVDLSEHQGEVDWQTLRQSGVDFVMLRVGYRGYTDGGLHEDTAFRRNVKAAQEAGIAIGVYFFSQSITEEEAEAEAAFVLDCIRGLDITWPVAFDWETIQSGGRTDDLSGRDMTRCALAFCDRIRDAGYHPAIYANQSLARLYFGWAEEEMSQIILWLADYGEVPEFDHAFTIWQYTDCGSLGGVETVLDLNLSFIDCGSIGGKSNGQIEHCHVAITPRQHAGGDVGKGS